MTKIGQQFPVSGLYFFRGLGTGMRLSSVQPVRNAAYRWIKLKANAKICKNVSFVARTFKMLIFITLSVQDEHPRNPETAYRTLSTVIRLLRTGLEWSSISNFPVRFLSQFGLIATLILNITCHSADSSRFSNWVIFIKKISRFLWKISVRSFCHFSF